MYFSVNCSEVDGSENTLLLKLLLYACLYLKQIYTLFLYIISYNKI